MSDATALPIAFVLLIHRGWDEGSDGEPHMIDFKCSECGASLNEGEAKTFTVCDECWDKAFPSSPSPDLEGLIARLEESAGPFLGEQCGCSKCELLREALAVLRALQQDREKI